MPAGEQVRITAKAVIQVGARFLMLRKPSGMWDLPGGRLSPGENPEDALLREAREELGMTVRIGHVVDCSVRTNDSGRTSVCVVSYHCQLVGTPGEVRLSDEHTEHALFAVGELRHLPMHDSYRRAVQRASRRPDRFSVNWDWAATMWPVHASAKIA